jgi:hypothetical protein
VKKRASRMGDKYKKIDGAGPPPGADIELPDRKSKDNDDAFDVRVLDVKKAGAPTIIRVPKNGTCADLRTAVESAIENAPADRQRLICNGRSLGDGLLSEFNVVPRTPPSTVHLTVRPEGTQASTPTANEVPYDVSALVAAVAANPMPSDPAARARFHVARTGARVRLLSSLLSLYCAVAALGAFLDATAPNSNGDVVTMVGLAINLAGVYVGGAGMRAARRGDILSACRYDHALRALAASSLAYEAYVSLVVIPEEARHRAPWDSQRPQTNGTTYTQNTSGVSRDDLFLSGVVSVLLWASIWLACLNSSAQYRLAVRDRDSAGVRAPDLEVQQPGDAFLL